MLVIPIIYAADYDSGTYGCGLYGVGCEAGIGEEVTTTYESGTEAGPVIRASEVAIMTEKLCNESGYVWYNNECYQCDGIIFEKDGLILCANCPEGFELLDGECKIVSSEVFNKKFLMVSLITIAILGVMTESIRRKRKKKKMEKKNERNNKPDNTNIA